MNLELLLDMTPDQLRGQTVHAADTITIAQGEATATSPEGMQASMPLDALLARVAARRMDTGGVVLADGIKAVLTEGGITIWVYESPPRIYRFLWIAPDSPAAFGPGAKYRAVRIALPYLIVLAVFAAQANGQLQLTGANECFFRVEPLRSLDDALRYPALLNCSRFQPPEGRPLAWICTQHLQHTPAMRDPDLNKGMAASFAALRRHLLESSFNLSSEHHEFSSWFTASRQADPRINTVEAWQAATAADPLFVLEVPWLETGHSVRQVAERIFTQQQARARTVRSAGALARIIFAHT
jgi:hypothetical protein